MIRVPALLAAVAALVAATAGLGAAPVAAAPAAGAERPSRVLVLSVPHLSWADVAQGDMPELERLLARSATAVLATRVDTDDEPVGPSYATLGAGSRALGLDGRDGAALMPDERFGASDARDAFAQRTGAVVDDGIVVLALAQLEQANDGFGRDAVVGALGDALRSGGYERVVVGNADARRPDLPPEPAAATAFHRELALALMTSDGIVPEGRVDRGLLTSEPAAPYGVVLDVDAVDAAFRTAWQGRVVALVEASDLARAQLAADIDTAGHAETARAGARRRTDELVGRVLARVDPARDAVLVVAPGETSTGAPETVIAVRAPGFGRGALESPTTGRTGFVHMVDVAPTILAMLGLPRPAVMDGRAATVTGGQASASDLAERAEVAQRRDERAIGVQVAAVVLAALAALGAVIAGERPNARGARRVAELGSPVVLALLPASLVARLAGRAGTAMFVLVIAATTLAIAAAYRACRRWSARGPLIAAMAVPVVVLGLDALTGTHLAFDTVLGVGSFAGTRFSGLGPIDTAVFATCLLVLAALVARRIGVALLVAGVLVLVVPWWGASPGDAVALALGGSLVVVALLRGGALRPVDGLVALGAGAVTLGVAALVELSAGGGARSGFGRLLERLDALGVDALGDAGTRHLLLIGRSVGATAVPAAFLLVVAFGAWLALRARPALLELQAEWPMAAACAVGVAVFAVAGTLGGDGGFATLGSASVIVLAVAVWATVGRPARRAPLEEQRDDHPRHGSDPELVGARP